MHPSIVVLNLNCNEKIGNWSNLIIGGILNQTPAHEVAVRNIVRAKEKAKLAGHTIDKNDTKKKKKKKKEKKAKEMKIQPV